MSTTRDVPQAAVTPRPLAERTATSRKRARTNAIMRAVLLVGLLLALIPLALILFVTIRNGAARLDWAFITETAPLSYRQEGGGFLHGLVGSAMIIAIATALAVPLGILGAIFLVEYRGNPFTRPTRFFTDVMTGVPSIFVGLFVFAGLVQEGLGFGTFVAGVAIAVLMLPIVVRSGEEILKLVPNDLRTGAYALGARRWQTVLKVVVPAAGPGLITGSLLAVARGLGETAPLILTAFGTFFLTTDLQGTPQTALPLLIFERARRPEPASQAMGWAGALELMIIVLILIVVARLITRRSQVGR